MNSRRNAFSSFLVRLPKSSICRTSTRNVSVCSSAAKSRTRRPLRYWANTLESATTPWSSRSPSQGVTRARTKFWTALSCHSRKVLELISLFRFSAICPRTCSIWSEGVVPSRSNTSRTLLSRLEEASRLKSNTGGWACSTCCRLFRVDSASSTRMSWSATISCPAISPAT